MRSISKPPDKDPNEDNYDFHANYQDYICDEDQELDSACSKKELVIDKTILLQRSATVGRIIIKGSESKFDFEGLLDSAEFRIKYKQKL